MTDWSVKSAIAPSITSNMDVYAGHTKDTIIIVRDAVALLVANGLSEITVAHTAKDLTMIATEKR